MRLQSPTWCCFSIIRNYILTYKNYTWWFRSFNNICLHDLRLSYMSLVSLFGDQLHMPLRQYLYKRFKCLLNKRFMFKLEICQIFDQIYIPVSNKYYKVLSIFIQKFIYLIKSTNINMCILINSASFFFSFFWCMYLCADANILIETHC